MAEPIRVSVANIPVNDAKSAATAIDQAVSLLWQ